MLPRRGYSCYPGGGTHVTAAGAFIFPWEMACPQGERDPQGEKPQEKACLKIVVLREKITSVFLIYRGVPFNILDIWLGYSF